MHKCMFPSGNESIQLRKHKCVPVTKCFAVRRFFFSNYFVFFFVFMDLCFKLYMASTLVAAVNNLRWLLISMNNSDIIFGVTVVGISIAKLITGDHKPRLDGKLET